MKLQVFTVYDMAVKAFLQPFYARSHGEAIRSFTELANDTGTHVCRHPSDFVLHHLGEFDDASGLFECVEPARVVSAREVVEDVTLPKSK